MEALIIEALNKNMFSSTTNKYVKKSNKCLLRVNFNFSGRIVLTRNYLFLNKSIQKL